MAAAAAKSEISYYYFYLRDNAGCARLPGVAGMIVERESTESVLATVCDAEAKAEDEPGAEEQQPETKIEQPANEIQKVKDHEHGKKSREDGGRIDRGRGGGELNQRRRSACNRPAPRDAALK